MYIPVKLCNGENCRATKLVSWYQRAWYDITPSVWCWNPPILLKLIHISYFQDSCIIFHNVSSYRTVICWAQMAKWDFDIIWIYSVWNAITCLIRISDEYKQWTSSRRSNGAQIANMNFLCTKLHCQLAPLLHIWEFKPLSNDFN